MPRGGTAPPKEDNNSQCQDFGFTSNAYENIKFTGMSSGNHNLPAYSK